MLIVGEKEELENKVAVRKQGEGDMGEFTIEDFAKLINQVVEESIKPF